MKKLISAILAVVMMVAMVAGCGANNSETGKLGASPLAEKELNLDYEVPDDFKIGFICLHDEKSTYDLNFINAAKTAP